MPTPSDSQPAQPTPLLPADPAKVGDFWLDARLAANPAGIAYVAHADDGESAMLILTSQGAAADAAARERLAGEVNKLHIDTVLARGGQGQDQGRLGHRFRPEDDDPVVPDHAPLAPWVALAFDGTRAAVAEAERILTEIDLSRTPALSEPAGPDYRLHWIDKTAPGPNRLWPLPWPGRGDRAGWVTILTSWLLMLLLAALAVLIAILLFQNAPPQSPPPPVPTQASGSGGGSGSPDTSSPQSGSPSPQSGSPSPESDDPTKPTHTPSMEQPSPSGSAPGEGTPTTNKKL